MSSKGFKPLVTGGGDLSSPPPLSKMRGKHLHYRDGMGINVSFIFAQCLKINLCAVSVIYGSPTSDDGSAVEEQSMAFLCQIFSRCAGRTQNTACIKDGL
jgi:hypothetical protein